MTKEEITSLQAMQYLEMLVALDNTQIAKDTLEYFKQLEEENAALRSDNLNVKDLLEEIAKQNKILDILKPLFCIEFTDDGEYESDIYYLNFKDECCPPLDNKNNPDSFYKVKEWLESDRV